MTQLYEVSYDILTQAKTQSFLGTGRSDLMNLKTTVQATGPGQAQNIVESQNGGPSHCVVKNAFPVR